MCKTSRIYRKTSTAKNSPFYPLFEMYILWGVTYEMLSQLSAYSIRYLEQQFHHFLEQIPPQLPKIQQTQDRTYLLIDGKWFDKRFVVMAYRQSKNLTLLHVSVAGREVASKISRDLNYLKKDCKYRFTGIVSDGGTGIVSAVKEVYSHVPHQICLAHMHRDMSNAIGRHPKDPRVIQLKALVDFVWQIESVFILRLWQKAVLNWISKHWDFLHEYRRDTNGKWWYVHTGVRKVTRMLQVLPYMSFTFLSCPGMPKTTNELEAQFGHLGKRWLAHRGLKRERWEQFLRWFVYFYNRSKLS